MEDLNLANICVLIVNQKAQPDQIWETGRILGNQFGNDFKAVNIIVIANSFVFRYLAAYRIQEFYGIK